MTDQPTLLYVFLPNYNIMNSLNLKNIVLLVAAVIVTLLLFHFIVRIIYVVLFLVIVYVAYNFLKRTF